METYSTLKRYLYFTKSKRKCLFHHLDKSGYRCFQDFTKTPILLPSPLPIKAGAVWHEFFKICKSDFTNTAVDLSQREHCWLFVSRVYLISHDILALPHFQPSRECPLCLKMWWKACGCLSKWSTVIMKHYCFSHDYVISDLVWDGLNVYCESSRYAWCSKICYTKIMWPLIFADWGGLQYALV